MRHCKCVGKPTASRQGCLRFLAKRDARVTRVVYRADTHAPGSLVRIPRRLAPIEQSPAG